MARRSLFGGCSEEENPLNREGFKKLLSETQNSARSKNCLPQR